MAGPETQNGVLEHIDALRAMLLKIIATYAVLCVPGWFLASPLLDYLLTHAVPGGFKIHYFTLLEPFFVMVKLTLTLAAGMSLPFTLFYIWQFVAPALHDDEKKFIRPLVLASYLLSCAGAAAAYFLLMPCVIAFSQSFSGPNMDAVNGTLVDVSVSRCSTGGSTGRTGGSANATDATAHANGISFFICRHFIRYARNAQAADRTNGIRKRIGGLPCSACTSGHGRRRTPIRLMWPCARGGQ